MPDFISIGNHMINPSQIVEIRYKDEVPTITTREHVPGSNSNDGYLTWRGPLALKLWISLLDLFDPVVLAPEWDDR